jgi:hypothetical protein
MGAEGEQILIDIPDKDGFAEELNRRNPRGRLHLGRKEKTPSRSLGKAKASPKPERPHTPPSSQVPTTPAPTEVTPEPRSAPRIELAPRTARLAEARAPSSATTDSPSGSQRATETEKPSLMERVDTLLAAAEKRWGSLMPTWFFTRLMAFVVVGAFLLMLIFPGAVSAFLLAAGTLMVIFGGVVYTDGMLASRWLPGRMTPIHVLIFGVAILMFGVLLGVIAR